MLARDDISAEIDDAAADNLAGLQRFADEIIEDNRAKFDEVCNILTGNRDSREKKKVDTAVSSRSVLRKYMGFLSGGDGPVDER